MFNEALDGWAGALQKWVTSAQTCISEIGSAGQKVFPSKWVHIVGAVESVAAVAESWRAPGGDLTALTPEAFGQLMDICDRLESATRLLSGATAVITSNLIKETMTQGMSRTYSENIRIYMRTVLAGETAAQNHRKAALAAASAVGAKIGSTISSDTLNAIYTSSPSRGGLATELYVNALVSGGSASLLSAAKDSALGLPADTGAAAAADSAMLSEYHPIQAMCYFVQPAEAPTTVPELADGKLQGAVVPSFSSRAAVPPYSSRAVAFGNSSPVDLAPPQARFALEYELELLTDRRRAQQFGQLATTTTGLNYKLVERLRTIRATPIPPSDDLDRRVPRGLQDAGSRFNTTMDRGATAVSTKRAHTWAPFGGCKPRVLAYADAAGALIHAAVCASGWDPDLGARYDKLATDDALPTGEGSSDQILAELVTEFTRKYDSDPPESAKHFRKLAVGDEFAPDGYIARALARVGEGIADDALRHELSAVGVARVPYADLARETRITQLRMSIDAAQVLWRRLRDAFRPDHDAFELPPLQRKATLVAGLKKAAEIALRAGPLIVSPPTLKLYAASRWLAPRSYGSKPSAKK